MDFSFPPEVEAFRTEVKAFLAENFDESMLDVTHDGTMHVPELMLHWRRKAGSPAPSRKSSAVVVAPRSSRSCSTKKCSSPGRRSTRWASRSSPQRS